jgi:hypothetical protein
MLVEKKNEKTMLTDQAYAFGKRLVQLILPAISALYFGLGKTPNDEGTSVRINLDPNDLVDKKAITLKVNPPILSDS